MEALQQKCCLKKCCMAGLTLIEVLIALAIIGIAMTAIIKATSQTIRSTAYLENKTIAMWVGQEIVNEARSGLLLLPSAPEKLQQTQEMLGKNWYWQAGKEQTANKSIDKIVVNVFENEEYEGPIISFMSYQYHA